MFPRRWIIAGVGLIVVLVLVFGLPAMQQSAWTQGYLVGRLSAGSSTGSGTGVDPMLPYLYGGGYRGPHFGGFGAVLLLVFLVFVAARVIHGCRGYRGWGGPGQGPQGGWQRHGHGPWGWGGPEEGGPGPERPGEGGTPTSRTGLV